MAVVKTNNTLAKDDRQQLYEWLKARVKTDSRSICRLPKSICFVKGRKHFSFVKIIPKKNDNFDLTLQKRLFCIAKQPLLPCKTYAFGLQNNRFCNALIMKRLCNIYTCEKYLHFIAYFPSIKRGMQGWLCSC